MTETPPETSVPHRPLRSAKFLRHLRLAFFAAVLLLLPLAFLQSANAQNDVKVVVTIHKVWERGCYGEKVFGGCVGGEDADFYTDVTIADQKTESKQYEDQSSIEPKDWVFTKTVAKDSRIPVTIEMWDYDSGLRGGDDHVDITGADGENLDMTLSIGKDPGGCKLERTGVPGWKAECGQRLSDGGQNEYESAGIEYTVDVIYPTRVGKLSVRCTHNPLWPQPGQAVQIQAVPVEIESGTFSTPTPPAPGPGFPPFAGIALPHMYSVRDIIADRVTIWFNQDSANVNRVKAQECNRPTGPPCSATVNPTGATFQYGCWVENAGSSVASNFREVTVGVPPGVNVVPVLYNGPKEKSADVVLHPDQGYAGGWTDPTFLGDANNLVGIALAEPTWYKYQNRFNIWISNRLGAPTWPLSGTGSTPNSTISLLDGQPKEAFADSAGIVHRRFITDGSGVLWVARDAASNGFFTTHATDTGSANVMRHEMGHAVFGLSDEYCCDGGYGENSPFPDVYLTQANCQADLPTLAGLNAEFLWPAPGPCRSFTAATPEPPPTLTPGGPTLTPAPVTPGPSSTPGPSPTVTPRVIWVSDPLQFQEFATPRADLMNGNDYGLTTDIRRFRWTFDTLCPGGDC